MKKFLSLMLSAGLFVLSLTGCGGETAETLSVELPADDSAYILSAENVETPVDGRSATIAVVVSSAGVEDGGYNQALWRGVQNFCRTFNFMPQSYTLEGDNADSAEQMVREAAESGASMVVCAGDLMETAVYRVQNNYPSVSYLLLDGEPHNEDHSSYQTASAVHCVLFREEQLGYLAGYAAVMDGYTSVGYLGTQALPEAVRYGTGFLQGAEAAAEKRGVQAEVLYWYCGTDAADEQVTQRMREWYDGGCQLVFAAGGSLAQSCARAAGEYGGKVIAAGFDQSALGDMVLSSAQKCLSRTVQQQLYKFYANGAQWSAADAGTTETLGIGTDSVGLSAASWKFSSFSLDDYAEIYSDIYDATVKVERISDAQTSVPDIANLKVEYQNISSLS